MATMSKIDILWAALWAQADNLAGQIWPDEDEYENDCVISSLNTCIDMLRTINTGNNIVSPSSFEEMAREYTTDRHVQQLQQVA